MNRTVFHKALIACLLISLTTGCLPAPTETPEATLARPTPTQEKPTPAVDATLAWPTPIRDKPTPVIEGTPLPFNVIEESDGGKGNEVDYAGEQPWIEILQQAGEIKEIEVKISYDAVEILSQIDFQSHIVVGIFQGLKPTSGYGVEILAVGQMGERISIYAEFIYPQLGMEAVEIVTAPYQLIKLDRVGLSGSRVFELIVEETTIQRVEVTIQ